MIHDSVLSFNALNGQKSKHLQFCAHLEVIRGRDKMTRYEKNDFNPLLRQFSLLASVRIRAEYLPSFIDGCLYSGLTPPSSHCRPNIGKQHRSLTSLRPGCLTTPGFFMVSLRTRTRRKLRTIGPKYAPHNLQRIYPL